MPFSLSRRTFALGAALLPIACSEAGRTVLAEGEGTDGAATSAVPVNPLVKNRADAQIFLHTDGYYYMTGSVPEYDRLVLRRAKTLAGLTDAEERVLWRHEEEGPLSGFIWAPEMHQVDGRWYVYFAAGPSGGGEDVFRIRTYAVECAGEDPMTGAWSVKGEFKAPWDSFNLDSKVFVHRGERYFTWAQREPGIETNSNLYIAKMTGPLTVGPATRLSVPTYDWEIRGFKVNEGAAAIENAGKLYMTYSASATDDRYCLGMLSIDADADLLVADNWTKSPEPVFQTSVATSVYGPGHNDFTVDEQGRPMLVYHGRDYKEIEGDPLFNPDRHTRVQRVYFDEKGAPDFGVPVGNGPLPERFISEAAKGAFLAHEDEALVIGAPALPQTQIRSLPAKDGTIQLSPILLREMCLTVGEQGTCTLAPRSEGGAQDGADRFRRKVEGEGKVRFESVAQAGQGLAAIDGTVALAPLSDPRTLWTVD
ncbi:family 43 glycosylhydrolase [Novosphingobium mangrovi (ex Hu et al. 2023)]|uniref:Glycoside hydrolase family 43 protein n=1 Tax=Novosphingobium mangrovi (ex Hu et al. 2023) TaxID=2930094 RepID=A0ABT0AHK1_9SPHN|nr:glycoside hydrolase family 43 protein [Novosphingobium mangrovi (ex Hu et al. 2023)]MCJ1962662.1 glycoside hydrolase family 43 protein [Novosphingobium mangrovi (ex Hu et al. 2023)]